MSGSQKVVAAATTILLWASAFPGIRAGLDAYGPGQLALLRYLFASLTMGMIAFAGRRSFHRPRLRDLPGIFALGAMGFAIYHGALNHGQVTVTSGSASKPFRRLPGRPRTDVRCRRPSRRQTSS